MSTGPAVPAGEVAVIEVGELTTTAGGGREPKSTALALGKPVPEKPVPVMVTDGAAGQGTGRGGDGGDGGGGHVGELVSGAGGAGAAGRGHGDVDRAGLTAAGRWRDRSGRVDDEAGGGEEPKSTALALGKPVPEKPVPVMATDVPPARGPAVGVTAVTVGAAT